MIELCHYITAHHRLDHHYTLRCGRPPAPDTPKLEVIQVWLIIGVFWM